MNNFDAQKIQFEIDSRNEPNESSDFFYHVANKKYCDASDLETVDPHGEDTRPPIHIEFIKQEDPEESNKDDNFNAFESVNEDYEVKREDSLLEYEEEIENAAVKYSLNFSKPENKKKASETEINNSETNKMPLLNKIQESALRADLLKLAENQLINQNLLIILPPIVVSSTFNTPSLNSAEKEKVLENEEKLANRIEQNEPTPKPVDHSERVSLRSKIIALLEAGKGVREIGRILGVHRNTVSNWKLRWKREGNLQDRSRCGAPRKTTKEQDKKIVDIFKNFPLTTSKEIGNNLKLPVSDRTIRNRLHAQDQASYSNSN